MKPTPSRDVDGLPLCDRYCPHNGVTVCNKTAEPLERWCVWQLRRDYDRKPRPTIVMVTSAGDGRFCAEVVGQPELKAIAGTANDAVTEIVLAPQGGGD